MIDSPKLQHVAQGSRNGDFVIIYAYTRAQAIADGVLIDLSQGATAAICSRFFKLPAACTSAVWSLIEVAVAGETGCDVNGILHDLMMMARMKCEPSHDVILFDCIVGEETRRFKLHVGPGDEGEPVLTLMFPDED